MSLKIAVCIKSVPDPSSYDSMKLDPETKTLIRTGIPSVINENDKHAIELAMQIKEKKGGEVVIFSMAPPNARTQLVEALSYGADSAYLLSDRKVGGADTLATSHSLAALIKKVGDFDIVIAGNESADGATAHVPSQLGEWMGFPHMVDIVGAEISDDESCIDVRKEYETYFADYSITLPCVLGVKKSINTVRYPNMMNIMKAKSKPLTVFAADDLPDLDDRYIGLAGSPTKAGTLIAPEYGRNGTPIEGSAEEIAAEIIKIIEQK